MGLAFPAIDKALTLGPVGFSGASSANMDAVDGVGDETGTATVTGQAAPTTNGCGWTSRSPNTAISSIWTTKTPMTTMKTRSSR